MPNAEITALLRERIDNLNTRLLIGELSEMAEVSGTSAGAGPESFFAALADLGRHAAAGGYKEAGRIAAELAVRAPSDGDAEALEMRLREGLALLQEAIAAAAASSRTANIPQPVRPLSEDTELIADFIIESREHLASVEQKLLVLEKDPAEADAINSIFRGFHTIKGLTGFLELVAMREVAHEVETALNLAREGKLSVTPAAIDVILACVDFLSRAIGELEAGRSAESDPGRNALLTRIRALTVQDTAPPTPQAVRPVEAPPIETPPESGPREDRHGGRPREKFSVRVDTDKLDYLMDMVGELVIAQSLVRHSPAMADPDARLQRDLTQLTRITAQVQRTAMAMRMVPVGQLFQRTARQIRDLSRKVGKQVVLVTRGEDIEVDKTIAEALADPIMHMVRNSIDHGIETTAERAASGKAPQATITLAACHQGGQIVIEVNDDGRGIDREKLLAKARQAGLVEDGSHLSDAEVHRLILEPGFSTAEQVTDISGRGVGMDVVRRQVEKLRGRIEIRTTPGRGATFLLRLPLTLAMIDGLVVLIGRERYIVPLFAVREMFRPAESCIVTLQNRREMAEVRGRLLPILRLYKRFGLTPRTADPCQALLIVAESQGRQFCIMVDDLVGKQEVVIKNLGEGLGSVPGIAGGAILGDGRVGLILDMDGLWGGHADA